MLPKYYPLVKTRTVRGGSEWGYFDNTKHLIFWLCNMKQLNFTHFMTNSKKIFEIISVFPGEVKKGSKKRPILCCLVYHGAFGHYDNSGLIISEDFRRLPKIPEGCRRLPKTKEEIRPLTKMPEEPSKHLTVFSLETVNIKKIT